MAHGYCTLPNVGGAFPAHLCVYGCTSDDECGDSICECGEVAGQCVPAGCTSGADCLDGYLCAKYDAMPGCRFMAYACQTPNDTCFSDADCNTSDIGNNACTIPDGVSRSCGVGNCAIGRPFLIENTARVAELASRGDWLDQRVSPALEHLTLSERAQLAREFSRAGQFEHASIAAFARFALELLALGAPPELLARTAGAMNDERRHAELCFGLASAYAGSSIGPDALSIEGALVAVSLEQSAILAFREGCAGETFAALEATELSLRAQDPCLRHALAGIAIDERHHADLAWQFVTWALRQGDSSVIRALTGEIDALREELRVTSPDAHDTSQALSESEEAHLAELGILTDSMRAAVRREAVTEVIVPALRAMLDRAVEEPVAA